MAWHPRDAEVFIRWTAPDSVSPVGEPMRLTLRGEGAGGGFDPGRWPAVAWTGGEAIVAWQDDRLGSPAVFVQRFGPDLQPRSEALQVSLAVGDPGLNDGIELAWSPEERRAAITWWQSTDGNFTKVHGVVSHLGCPATTPQDP